MTSAVTPRFALVTGGGSGVGRASAIALAEAGWTLMLAGRGHDALRACADEIATRGGLALTHVTDVSRPSEVDALFETILESFGRLDLVFNNAGMFAPRVKFEDLTFAQWQQVVDVNLTGVFLCMQGAFRLMKSQSPRGGRIINNGSISATTPRPDSAPYTSTKHAVSGLTKAGSLDGRAYDIAVGQIDIGNAATNMTDQMPRGMAQADGRVIPEAVMDVEHVARAIVYMAGLPLEANVQFMTVMATKMPFVGRG